MFAQTISDTNYFRQVHVVKITRGVANTEAILIHALGRATISYRPKPQFTTTNDGNIHITFEASSSPNRPKLLIFDVHINKFHTPDFSVQELCELQSFLREGCHLKQNLFWRDQLLVYTFDPEDSILWPINSTSAMSGEEKHCFPYSFRSRNRALDHLVDGQIRSCRRGQAYHTNEIAICGDDDFVVLFAGDPGWMVWCFDKEVKLPEKLPTSGGAIYGGWKQVCKPLHDKAGD